MRIGIDFDNTIVSYDALFHKVAREQGVIVRGIRDLIALSPPLVVTHDELARMFAAVGRALDRLQAGS